MGRSLHLALGLVGMCLLTACGEDSSGTGAAGPGGQSTQPTGSGGAGANPEGGGGSSAGGNSSSGGGGAGGSAVVEPPVDPCTSGEEGTSAVHFVAKEGSGANGASWADAWTDVADVDWEQIAPDSTLCIAGGSYGSLSVQTSGTEGARVCIRRATADDPLCGASAAGWNGAFDTEVVVTDIGCAPGSCSHVTIDGRVPYVGLRVADPSTGESYAVNLNQSGADAFHLYNVDIAGIATMSTDFTGDGRALSALSSSPTHGLHVAYCQLHGKPTLVLTAGQHEMLFERNRLFDNVVGNPGAWHPNVWVSVSDDVDVVWRYNEVSNWMVEGIMMCPNGTGCTPAANWYIYGNLWHDATPESTSRVLEAQYETAGPIFLYNNTFANLAMVMGSQGNGGAIAGAVAQNNLMWNVEPNFGLWNVASTADITASADPFVGSASGDYHLSAGSEPVNAGVVIAPAGGLAFDRDLDGTVRGADGQWDVGAYERP